MISMLMAMTRELFKFALLLVATYAYSIRAGGQFDHKKVLAPLVLLLRDFARLTRFGRQVVLPRHHRLAGLALQLSARLLGNAAAGFGCGGVFRQAAGVHRFSNLAG